jgi:hypothetical protein
VSSTDWFKSHCVFHPQIKISSSFPLISDETDTKTYRKNISEYPTNSSSATSVKKLKNCSIFATSNAICDLTRAYCLARLSSSTFCPHRISQASRTSSRIARTSGKSAPMQKYPSDGTTLKCTGAVKALVPTSINTALDYCIKDSINSSTKVILAMNSMRNDIFKCCLPKEGLAWRLGRLEVRRRQG